MLRIGTRGSKLALFQANWVREQALLSDPGMEIETTIIRTSADKDTLMPIRSSSGRGVFVKEIEEALLAGEVDLAVHSMKDLPTRIPDALEIRVIPAREDARDALLSGTVNATLESLPAGAVIGTGSVRRQAQLLALRPDLRMRDIRGNVDTRLQKLRAGGFDAVILACAGLNRLGLDGHISVRFDFSDMLPAPGQGALAVETRRDDSRISDRFAFLHHAPTARAVLAERAFLRRMGGGCNSPIAVHAWEENGSLRIDGLVGSPDGTRMVRESASCEFSQGEEAATDLAERILARGGQKILESLKAD